MICACGCGGRPREGKRFVHLHHVRVFDHAAAFWAKVDKSPGHGPRGDCWVWTGSRNEHGYGSLTVRCKRKKAHRQAWEYVVGPIPDGMELCHSCDFPPCVKPEHMFVGTHADNHEDAAAKGLACHGEGHRFAKLTDGQVREIREAVEGMAFRSQGRKELARRFGISESYISELVAFKTRRLA